MKNFHIFHFLNIVLVAIFITFSTSCISVELRQNARKQPPPRTYPAVRTLFFQNSNNGEGGGGRTIKLEPQNFSEYCLLSVLVGAAVVFFIIDIPLEFALDTILFPTDLIFGPGALIADEPNPTPHSRSLEPKEIADRQAKDIPKQGDTP